MSKNTVRTPVPAVVLADAAEELSAHERMEFRVLVDRPIDADEQDGFSSRFRSLFQE